MIPITLNGVVYEAEPGSTVLQTARAHGIKIPTLCYHPALRPAGACKLCAVEVETATGRQVTLLSCALKVREGLVARTDTDLVKKARTKAFEKLLQLAPHSDMIRKMAADFGVEIGTPPDGCIRCRLCVRVCKEVVGPAALEMQKRDGREYVMPVFGRCIGCGTCVNICPTRVIRMEDAGDVRTILIRDEIIGRHPLETCEGCGKRYATPRFLHHIEERTAPHPHVAEDHHYCPTCAKLFSRRLGSADPAGHPPPSVRQG